MINARGETVAEKPAFRAAFKQRRCLVLADGFYEWQATGKGRHKQPLYFHLQDGKPFALAGLWERWQNADTVLTTCTIITTAANELLRPIHERMPVIVPPEAYSQWLDPAVTQREPLEALLTPFPADAMTGYPVSRTVNNVRNDSPACIAPAEG
jgi:putative SOS response-associated peptidase YedK